MIQQLPNLITLINLVCGATACLCLIYGRLELVFGLVVLAGIADVLDGLVARALKVQSELGKQLDSLADMVSFGLVPGIIFYGLISAAQNGGNWPTGLDFKALPGLLLTACAALRLGKFNIDTRQSEEFIGLPTPACTLFVLGLLAIYLDPGHAFHFLLRQTLVISTLLAVFSYLMLAEIPMFSFKFKALTWKGNEIRFIFAAIFALMIGIWRWGGLSPAILLYVALSILLFFKRKTAP